MSEAAFLEPPQQVVERLLDKLTQLRVGIVVDVELQEVLHAVKMGHNLLSLLDAILDTQWSDERIARELHPMHNQQTIQSLRDNLNVYPSGNCVVHHMFGQSVVDTVNTQYKDAYVTAHLEVPGEMFQIALEKSLKDEGVVGSTSNILQFIE